MKRRLLNAVQTIWQERGLGGMYRKQASATAFRMGIYNILNDYERTH